jgi:hypothetical protein
MVTVEFRLAVLRGLPQKGGITRLKEAGRRKLAAIPVVLRMHQREGVYDVKIIDLPNVFIGLHARSVILISNPALNLLTQEELQALAAHEAGHEYVWSEFEKARHVKDFERMQELELFCDAVSVITMRRAGLDPSRLISSIEALMHYTQEHFGVDPDDPDERRYVAPDKREKFIRIASKWAASGDSPAAW